MRRLTIMLLVISLFAAQSAATARGKDDGDPPAKDIARVYVPRKWALLIGVNDYMHVRKLNYCAADIKALAEHLVKAGFAEDHVLLMEDAAADLRFKPWKNNIDKQLAILASVTKPDDLVFVAFSGHGVLIKDATSAKDGVSYLCPADADLDNPADTMVPLDKVYRTLDGCQARRKILLIDACRNDPEPTGVKSLSETNEANKEFALALRKTLPGGILLLNSCAPGQRSLEDDKFRQGVFMHFFMEGLEGKAARPTGSIHLLDLFLYAEDKTTVHVWRKMSVAQTPVFSGRDFENFEFVKLDPAALEKSKETAKEPAITPHADNIAPIDAAKTMAATLATQGDRYFADGNYEAAIHAYGNALNLDPKNSALYVKRGAAYRAKGDIKMAVIDYQTGNAAMELTVTAVRANLMERDKVAATVYAGQSVSITRIQSESGLDWLWVESVAGNTTAKGWIQIADITPKPITPPAPPRGSANQNGGYQDADYNTKQHTADQPQDRLHRLGAAVQRATDAKAARERPLRGGRGGR